MRILSVQHYPTFGGPTNEIVTLEAPMREMGIETIVAITDEPGDAVPRLQSAGVPTIELPLSRLRLTGTRGDRSQGIRHFRADVARLSSLIRGLRPDLVKVHGPHNPQGAIAAFVNGLPVVWVVSSTRVPKWLRPIGGLAVAVVADSVLVNGKALVDEYPGLSLARDQLFAYYPPVDVGRFRPLPSATRERVRDELGIPRAAGLVATVANVNPQKGIEVFIEAARHVADARYSHFMIVGAVASSQVEYYSRLKEQVYRLGLSEQVHWMGGRADVERLVAAADVKVITSRPQSEGTTTTAAEAMACEVPVVATDVGAVSEVVRDGVTGVLTSPDDAGAIAAAVVGLLNDPAERRSMGARGRADVAQRFSARVCAETHDAAFRCAIGRSRPKSTRAVTAGISRWRQR